MKVYKADLHIHTLFSPCGSPEMTPDNIVKQASKNGLNIIGIADHNTTIQAPAVKKIAEKYGIYVLCGAEVTSKDEIHCLTFFENEELLKTFQLFINENLIQVKNNPNLFGNQFLLNEEGNIIHEEQILLSGGLMANMDEIIYEVRKLNGIFIPSHINRGRNSLLSQLGLVPNNFNTDALEIDRKKSKEELLKQNPEVNNYNLIINSDAHTLSAIGAGYSYLHMEELTFNEIKMALNGKNGRRIEIRN